MNPHDDDINKVLAGLKVAEPEDGMEARILRRLALRAERRVASPWRMRIACALGAGAVFAATVPLVVHRSHAVVPPIEKTNNVVAQPAVVAVARPAVVVRATSRVHVHADRAVTVQAASAGGGEQLAAESFPAPPMPLTEQEKLLLRIAHRGETQERELPTPLPLGTEVAALRAGADKFFEDPTTGENKWKQLVALQAAPN